MAALWNASNALCTALYCLYGNSKAVGGCTQGGTGAGGAGGGGEGEGVMRGAGGQGCSLPDAATTYAASLGQLLLMQAELWAQCPCCASAPLADATTAATFSLRIRPNHVRNALQSPEPFNHQCCMDAGDQGPSDKPPSQAWKLRLAPDPPAPL